MLSCVCGTELTDEQQEIVEKFNLYDWPHTEQSACKPDAWSQCIRGSPRLLARLRETEERELRRMFNVGNVTLPERMCLKPEQAFVLGYLHLDGVRSCSPLMISRRMTETTGAQQWGLTADLGQMMVRAASRVDNTQRGARAELDLNPSANVDNSALVKIYEDAAPKKRKSKRKRRYLGCHNCLTHT